jgi:hypothetical protein
MTIDEQSDPALAPSLAALRIAMQAQHAPDAVQAALMTAFANQFPARRWYHKLSPRQWLTGVGSGAAFALMLLVIATWVPVNFHPGTRIAVQSVDEGSAFIALESAERIEQEAEPRLVEADLPRTALAALGLPVNPENAGDAVRAEMLVAADGSPLALRLVSLP